MIGERPSADLPIETFKAASESKWVAVSRRISLVASIQALYVLAARVEAADPSRSVSYLLGTLSDVLPACLAAAICRADHPLALLEALGVPASAAPFLNQGWALSIGQDRERLGAPGTTAVKWRPQLRTRPLIAGLHGPHDGLHGNFTRNATGVKADNAKMLVLPIAHPEGIVASPICLAEELARRFVLRDAWDELVAGAARLPRLDTLCHLNDWLWHFDAFLQIFLHAIPAYWEGLRDAEADHHATYDTLFEQSRLSGAIATSLFRFYTRTVKSGPIPPDNEPPLLLMSGIMEPIQDYILGFSSTTPMSVDAILRGRSSFLSLLVNVASYRMCTDLCLPPANAILSAASKFTILAPNTFECREILKDLQVEFDQWALEHLYGQTRLTLAMMTLSEEKLENDFLHEGQWKRKKTYGVSQVFAKLSESVDRSRFHRFQLCKAPKADSESPRQRWTPPTYLGQFHDRLFPLYTLCTVDGCSPATYDLQWPLSEVAAFQISLASVLISERPLAILSRLSCAATGTESTENVMNLFGYRVEVTSRHPSPAEISTMSWDLRCWSDSPQVTRWSGLCRKPLAVYASGVAEPVHAGIPTRQVFKGDIDHLGMAFQRRIPRINLSRIAAQSRELEAFFSIWVPRQLSRAFPDIVTVYSGGDDFVFLGPPLDIMEFSKWFRREFKVYSGDKLWISGGLSMPFGRESTIGRAITEADDALSLAKEERNRVALANSVLKWEEWEDVVYRARSLHDLLATNGLTMNAAVAMGDVLSRHSNGSIDTATALPLLDDMLRSEARRVAAEHLREQWCDDKLMTVPDASPLDEATLLKNLRDLLMFEHIESRCDRALVPLALAYMLRGSGATALGEAI